MSSELTRHSLVVVYSFHHKNTAKVAKAMAEVLDAQTHSPEKFDPTQLQDYALIGFGSGIYGAKHHQTVLDLANRLPEVISNRAFIFSTSAIITKTKVAEDHAALRAILESKGYIVANEFSCRGFNTNSFLKYFGGMNRGRPNAEDLERAREFALGLRSKTLAA